MAGEIKRILLTEADEGNATERLYATNGLMVAGTPVDGQMPEVQADGSAEFAYPGRVMDQRWDDFQLLGNARLGATSPVFGERANGVYMWKFANNDELHSNMQLSHMWDLGNLRPHLHWEPAADATVSFTANLHWIASPAQGGVITGSDTFTVNAAKNLGTVYIDEWDQMSFSALFGISTLINFRLKVTDLSGADIWLHGWDVHFRKTRFGSVDPNTLP